MSDPDFCLPAGGLPARRLSAAQCERLADVRGLLGRLERGQADLLLVSTDRLARDLRFLSDLIGPVEKPG